MPLLDYLDGVFDAFRQSLSLRLLLYFLALFLAQGLVVGIFGFALAVAGILIFLGMIGNLTVQNLVLVISSTEMLLASMLLFFTVSTIFVLVVLFISGIFEGIRFNLVDAFARTGKISMRDSFKKTRPRLFTYFFSNLVVIIFLVLVLFLLMSPFLSLVPGIFSSFFTRVLLGNPEILAGILPVLGNALTLGLLGGILFLAFLFLISPFTMLLNPVVFFEKKGFLDSVRAAVHLAKENYLANIAFFVMHIVILLGAYAFSQSIGQFFGALILGPPLISMLTALLSGEAAMMEAMFSSVSFFLSVQAFRLVYMLVFVPFMLWSPVFQKAAARMLFALKAGNAKQGRKTKEF